MSVLKKLMYAVDDALDPPINRPALIRNFVETYHFRHTSLYKAEEVLSGLLLGGAGYKGDTAAVLYRGLSTEERGQVNKNYLDKLQMLGAEFPELKQQYPDQFCAA